MATVDCRPYLIECGLDPDKPNRYTVLNLF